MTFPSPTAAERHADFLIHAISLAGFAVAGVLLVRMAYVYGEANIIAASIIYVISVMASILVSFAYHLLPRHEWRAILRRWDHAAIYLVIAGAFSPMLVKTGTTSAQAIFISIWALACVGVWFKLSGNNGDSKWSLASYLGLGSFALVALPDFWSELPHFTTYAILTGAIFYSIGTVFYRQKGMRFRYPIWHAWGTLGGTSFFVSIWTAVSA